MDIGIIGAGQVGITLGRGLGKAGHRIFYGVRDPSAAKHEALRGEDDVVVTTVPEAVARARAVILATPWATTREALAVAGDFAGKPLIDATNPIGPDLSLTHGHDDSGGEQVSRWATNARVVKAFNTTGLENMADPSYAGTPATMFVCGDDGQANELAAALAKDLGFEPLIVGDSTKARLLEPAALLWIKLAIVQGNGRDIAYKLLRREAQ